MPKSEPRAGIRANTRKIESRSTASDPRSIQRLEPVMRSPQQPLRSRRRPSTVPGSGSRDPPSAPSLENHEACLATVETLEQEFEALERDKKTLSERLRVVGSKKQKLLSERQNTQQLVLEMQHTVTNWHQRLWSPAGLPENADPAALRTALPATTVAPDMWTIQEDGGVSFDNNHDIAPGSDDFTQLLQF
ncbi:hypothetical protein BDQ94DRAFT_155662 [Aspergillus welwitschiae]|uniref:Uncharacterized protein n=1 Tax=Aspergillus welwitschiae TaxID=1341132 RepID=A0A3F3PHN2_9EURO|nr:hypothetical protein BDQ94DRAFT_155662 [Aspergillus welwitschiae]RDH26367.1 hypothetical protein BDQ94DRAFT_155662 [Aspergillus welwitschiae]